MDPTAAPVDLKIGNQTYLAYPLRDIDHETMNKWVRREYMDRVKDSIEGDEDLQRIALSRVLTMNWMANDGLRITNTVKGLHKLACLLCRKPDIPYEGFDVDTNLSAVFDAYMELHPSSTEETGGSSQQAPKESQ